MGKLRYRFAFFMARLSIPALKATGHKATDFPGILAHKICPDFLKYIEIPEHVYAVTGTNGKTTITNLVADSLDKLGRKNITNRGGANTVTGVITALVSTATPTGKCKCDTAVFEIDERSTRIICPYIKPEVMLVANLSRDSIMRTGHPQYVRDILTEFIPPETKLLLNADDLNASTTAPSNPRKYYGIEPMPGDNTECMNIINDVPVCPNCSAKLRWKYIRYSNIGRAYCPECGFTSPEYDYSASDVDLENMTMTFKAGDSAGKVRVLNKGIFNIYNQTAAMAFLCELGYSREDAAGAVAASSFTKTRLDEEEVNGVKVQTMLCKGLNGYAASRVLEYIRTCDGPKEFVIMTNSLDAEEKWSEDICWIYDCDVEFIADDTLEQIIVHGARGKDYRVRLLYAGIPAEKITLVETSEDSIDKLKLKKGETVFVLYDLDVIDRGLMVAEKIKDRLRGEGGAR